MCDDLSPSVLLVPLNSQQNVCVLLLRPLVRLSGCLPFLLCAPPRSLFHELLSFKKKMNDQWKRLDV